MCSAGNPSDDHPSQLESSWERILEQVDPTRQNQNAFLSLTASSIASQPCPGFPPAGMPLWLWGHVLPEGWQRGKSLINLLVVAVSGITLGSQRFSAPTLPSVPQQLSLELCPPLGGAPRKGRSLCVVLPLLAPSHPVLVTKPKSWKPKRAQISVTDETPRKEKNLPCCGEGTAWLVTHQDPVLVCGGLWLLVRVSQLASDLSFVQVTCCCEWSQDS